MDREIYYATITLMRSLIDRREKAKSRGSEVEAQLLHIRFSQHLADLQGAGYSKDLILENLRSPQDSYTANYISGQTRSIIVIRNENTGEQFYRHVDITEDVDSAIDSAINSEFEEWKKLNNVTIDELFLKTGACYLKPRKFIKMC